MTTKERLRKFRTECRDWDDVIASFTLWGGMSKRDAELGLLSLVDLGLVRIEPNPNGPTALFLTLPEGIREQLFADSISEEVLSHV